VKTIPAAEVEIRDLDPKPTVAVRVMRTPQDLAAAFPDYLPQIAHRMADLGGEVAGPPYARYHRFEADRVDVEIGAPVAVPVTQLRELAEAAEGEVARSELPGGRAAVLVHTGPYSRIGESWAQLSQWIAAAGHSSAAPGWEDYIDDPERTPPEELRTELVHPIG
jgi:effector-binding domain-containing protein